MKTIKKISLLSGSVEWNFLILLLVLGNDN